MTELQMGLIGLGAAVVVGVFGYNKWQEYRQRKLTQALLKPQQEDVLLGAVPGVPVPAAVPAAGERSEPELGTEAPGASLERREPVLADDQPIKHAATPDVSEPVLVPDAPTDDEGEGVAELPAGPVPGSLLDPRLELIVALELVDPVPATQVINARFEDLQRAGKPMHWVAFNDLNRQWERLAVDSEAKVRRLRIGLQLVDRQGPVSEAGLMAFTGAVHALADELLAVADLPATRPLDQASEIDRFCASVDLEIGVNLVSCGTPFSGTKIRALAEAAGMVLGGDGAFTRHDDDGRTQFTLQNFETARFDGESIRNLTTHGLTFVLDVPRVDHGERVFLQMVDLARRFGETLQGVLVDDNWQPLNDLQLEHIRREFIGKPQAIMASYGLPAGSPQALRLFS